MRPQPTTHALSPPALGIPQGFALSHPGVLCPGAGFPGQPCPSPSPSTGAGLLLPALPTALRVPADGDGALRLPSSSRGARARPVPGTTQRRWTHRDGPGTGRRRPRGGERPGRLRGPSWCCRAEGSVSGAGGAAGLLSAPCSAPLAMSSFYPWPWGGCRSSRKENECIIPGKLCQDHPVLLSWRRQGNRRRGSAAHGAATFRFHLGARRGLTRAQTPTTSTLPLLQGPHRP